MTGRPVGGGRLVSHMMCLLCPRCQLHAYRQIELLKKAFKVSRAHHWQSLLPATPTVTY